MARSDLAPSVRLGLAGLFLLGPLLSAPSAHAQVNAGALLDAALEACAQGQTLLAQQRFNALLALNPPESIRLVIEAAQQGGCSAAPLVKVGGFWALGRASNVNAAPSEGVIQFPELSPIQALTLAPEERPRSDSFTSLGVTALTAPVLPTGLRLSAAGQLRRYAQEAAYRSGTLVLGAEHPMAPAQGSLGLQLGHWRFGDDGQDSQVRLHWDGMFGHGLPSGGRLGYSLGYAWAHTQTITASRARRVDLGVWGQWPLGRQTTLVAGLNAGQDRLVGGVRQGGDRSSLQGHVQIGASMGETVQFTVGLAWLGLKDNEPYNAVFFGDQPRQSRRWQLSLQAEGRRPLLVWGATKVHGFASLSLERVKDRIPLFTQTSQSFQLGLAVPTR